MSTDTIDTTRPASEPAPPAGGGLTVFVVGALLVLLGVLALIVGALTNVTLARAIGACSAVTGAFLLSCRELR